MVPRRRRICFRVLSWFYDFDQLHAWVAYEWMIGKRSRWHRFVRWVADDTEEWEDWLADDVGDKGFSGAPFMKYTKSGHFIGMDEEKVEEFGLKHWLNTPPDDRLRVVRGPAVNIPRRKRRWWKQ